MSQHKGASGRSEPTPSKGGIPTPKWWFKSKNQRDVRTLAPGEKLADDARTTLVDEPPLADVYADEQFTPSRRETASVDEPADADPTMRPQPVSVSVDPDRQLINLKLSYTSALIGAFGLFIVVGVAVLIGKSFSRGPAPANAEVSTAALRQGPPTAGVMNPRRTDTGGNDLQGTAPPRTNTNGGGGGNNSTGTRNPQSFTETRPPATFFTDDPHRQTNLNYAIIQSYPDRETAEKAADFLTKNGIACTVERSLPNWPLPWKDGCIVVGLRGFAKISNNPGLEAYQKSIMDVSAKFANGRSRFVAFKPTMYLWRKAN